MQINRGKGKYGDGRETERTVGREPKLGNTLSGNDSGKLLYGAGCRNGGREVCEESGMERMRSSWVVVGVEGHLEHLKTSARL